MMEYIYDTPTRPPQESAHWQSLPHREGDTCIVDAQQLCALLVEQNTKTEISMPLWSAVLGYCEALCTGKEVRYNPYPIPIDALQRMVDQEFTPPILTTGEDNHREAARQVSNWVWAKVVQKSNVKDEKHANSLYTVLRGKIDNKSVDCFGAALVTVVALRQQGYPSMLTLSEDHAYESHGDGETCEVAMPGNTKAQKQKRGQEIAATFQKANNNNNSNNNNRKQLSPATSWLYMAGNAVTCHTSALILAAAIANINCLIENKSTYEKYSQPLLVLKRDLLWILKDSGHLDRFPFALCELGWAEEHATSPRGEARVSIEWDSVSTDVTTMEALYHEAVQSSKTHYKDKQVYPYCYLGFFHKDGGQHQEEEYRLGLALQFFSEAARVASTYQYDSGDTLQLTKVFTKVSEFVVYEILCSNNKPREWHDAGNAVTSARWLIIFFDYLLLWEEQSGSDSFVPICKPNHKTGIAKAFAQLPPEIRQQAFQGCTIQSRRLQGPLRTGLEASKPSVSEMHLTILSDSGRRRKRKSPS